MVRVTEEEAVDGVVCTPDVVVWVHPINIKLHPTYRPGYRWAVHVGGLGASVLTYCCNAGREDDLTTARIVGESYGAAVCKALRMFRIAARYSICELAWDPIPSEADDTLHKVWNGESGDVL